MWGKLKNAFSSMKIRHKVRLLFLIVLAVYLVALFLIFGLILRNQIYEYALENNRKSVMTIGSNLTSEIEKVNNFSRLLFANETVLEYLDGNPMEYLDGYTKAVDAIYGVQYAYPEVSSVFVFRNDGRYLTVGKGYTSVNEDIIGSPEWLKEINDKDGGYVLRLNGGRAFENENQSAEISLIRNINDIDTLKKKGMLAVNFPLDMLEDTYLDSLGDGRHFAYLDSRGDIVCQDIDSEKFSNIKIEENRFKTRMEGNLLNKTIYCYYKVPRTSFILLSYEEISLFRNMSEGVVISVIFLVLLTAVVLIGIGAFISVYITAPIQKLVESMEGVKDGWLRRVSIKNSNDEIGLLKDSYNDMLLEAKRLIEQLLEKEQSIRKAEIDILQEQIKPHFLYNTIEMIACLSLEEKGEDVYNALETLGRFYRQFLSKGENEVTLKTELEIIQDYLTIQKLRYGNIFEDVYIVDETCLNTKLPKLILQPLVENSLYHGIRLKGERGIIRIRVFKEEQNTYIEVYDTGIGMDSERLSHIMDADSGSFGLRRTMERFMYFTNDKGSYTITSEVGRYTSIMLKIGISGVSYVQSNDY